VRSGSCSSSSSTPPSAKLAGTQFTFFTSTKVQILAPEVLLMQRALAAQLSIQRQFTCFTGTKVEIVTQKRQRALAAQLSRQRHQEHVLHAGLVGARYPLYNSVYLFY
jgi:hypothetical protein